MKLRKIFVPLALGTAIVGSAMYLMNDDGSRPLPVKTVTQPSSTPLPQVAFLDKHFSLRETMDSFQDRFHALAKDLGRAEVARNIEERLVVVNNEILTKNDGKVSHITDPVLQQRVSNSFYNIITDGFEQLRKNNEARFDKVIQDPKHAEIRTTYLDLKSSEKVWRAINVEAPVIPTVRADAAADDPIVLAEANLPPQNGKIYFPKNKPQFKGFTSEQRLRDGAAAKQRRDAKRHVQQFEFESETGLDPRLGLSFGPQASRRLPGVFNPDGLTSLKQVADNMAKLSQTKTGPEIAQRAFDIQLQALRVAHAEIHRAHTTSLTNIDVTKPEVEAVIVRAANFAQWMTAPENRDLFNAAMRYSNPAAVDNIRTLIRTSAPIVQRYYAKHPGLGR